jgi:hypothetical protein
MQQKIQNLTVKLNKIQYFIVTFLRLGFLMFLGIYSYSTHCIPALALLPRTYHLMPTVKHLLSKVSNQSAPSEDVAL